MSTEELFRDVGAPVRARSAPLAAARAVVSLLARYAPIAVFLAAPDGSYEDVNERWCELSGIARARALGEGWLTALHPDDRAQVVWPPAEGDAQDVWACTYRFRLPDGRLRPVESRAHALRDANGRLLGWVGACVEPGGREAVPDRAPGSDERYRLAFEHAPIGTCLVDPEGDLIHANGAFCALVGYPAEELLTLNLADLAVPGDGSVNVEGASPVRGECRYRRADGTAIWVATASAVVPGPNGEALYHVVQVEDIGDRKQAERELRQLADHDALTGLLNRRGFMDGLHRELRRMDRRGEYGALLVLDLDNFKLVNDTAGHLVGDQVLRTTAEVLRGRLRATDVIGRLGGDEFAALVLNVTPRQAREIAAETAEALRALTVNAGEHRIEVAASVGIVAINEMRTENEDELLAAADRAMYRTKSLRRDG